MANKGETKSQKTLSARKVLKVGRKGKVWVIKTGKGAHSKKTSIPIGIALREFLGFAKNLKEIKRILHQGFVTVNGVTVKKTNFPIGLFDIIQVIPKKEFYRVLIDNKSRITLKKVEGKDAKEKLCKITKKKKNSVKDFALTTNDGRTIITKDNFVVGSTIKISVPEQKVIENMELKKGNTAFITGGTHAGTIAVITKVIPGTLMKKSLVSLKEGKKEFSTVKEKVFVIGKDKPVIEGIE
ncbi:MAG: S4 domain-containing protein [archaeon]